MRLKGSSPSGWYSAGLSKQQLLKIQNLLLVGNFLKSVSFLLEAPPRPREVNLPVFRMSDYSLEFGKNLLAKTDTDGQANEESRGRPSELMLLGWRPSSSGGSRRAQSRVSAGKKGSPAGGKKPTESLSASMSAPGRLYSRWALPAFIDTSICEELSKFK